MAFLAQDDKELDPNQPNQNGGQTPSSGSAPLQNSGNSIVSDSSAPSTAGVTAGGGGNWTNLQSYLKANEGNNASSDYLKTQAGSAFDQDTKQLHDQANQATSSANQQVSQNNLGTDQASKIISQAGNLYNYSGAQKQTYQDAIKPVQTALTSQYEGPSSFNYGLSGETQNYGNGLTNNFSGLMDSLYQKKAESPLSTGQLSLQHQLDQENPTLDSTRKNLLSQYAGLNSDLSNTLNSTQAALSKDQNDFKTNQSGLKTYLTGESTKDQTAVKSRADAINSYAKSLGQATEDYYFPNDPSFRSPASYTSTLTAPAANEQNATGVDQSRNQFNALSDILGTGSKIGKSTPYSLSNDQLNENVHNNQYGFELNYNKNLGQFLNELHQGAVDPAISWNSNTGQSGTQAGAGGVAYGNRAATDNGNFWNTAKALGLI